MFVLLSWRCLLVCWCVGDGDMVKRRPWHQTKCSLDVIERPWWTPSMCFQSVFRIFFSSKEYTYLFFWKLLLFILANLYHKKTFKRKLKYMKISFLLLCSFLISSLHSIAQDTKKFDPANARDGENIEYCHQHVKMAKLRKNQDFIEMNKPSDMLCNKMYFFLFWLTS